MALGDAYATAVEYRSDLKAPDSGSDLEIERDLLAVSRFIDQQTARQNGFNRDDPDDDPVVRYYDAPRGRHAVPLGWAESENPWKASGARRVVDIDDHVAITEIAIDESCDNTFGTVLTTDDYELFPRNATTRPEPEPYHQVALTEWGSQWAWTPGARIRVTGYGGWPAVPAAIKSACIQLTALLRLESPRATNRMSEGIGFVTTTSRAARDILDDIVRTYRPGRSYL